MIAGLCILALTACGGGAADPGEVPLLTVDEELRIGAVDGPTSLGEVISLAVGAGGEVFVAEWNEGSIGVFDRDGIPRARIGRSGSGPGEFTMNPGALHWTGEFLSAADPVARRLHLFRRDGTLERTIDGRWEPVSHALAGASPSRLLADGSVLGSAYPQASDLVRGNAPDAMLVRMDSASSTAVPIARIPYRNATLLIERNPGYTMTVNPVRDETLWTATADGAGIILVERTAATSAEPTSFTVVRLDLQGDTVFARSLDYTPIALTREVADSISDALARRLGQGQDVAKLRAALDGMNYLPAFFPPVESLVAGDDGSIWVRRTGTADPASWDVLDAEGDLVRRVAVPAALRVYAANEHQLWGVVRDELDVNYIVRYRIVRR